MFACIHNAGRSQMAAALLQRSCGSGEGTRYIRLGTSQVRRVLPWCVDVMREVGIDLADIKPQKLTDDLARGATVLVTMGCGDACPVCAGREREDWPLRGPEGEGRSRSARAIRDEIARRVRDLIAREREVGRASGPACRGGSISVSTVGTCPCSRTCPSTTSAGVDIMPERAINSRSVTFSSVN